MTRLKGLGLGWLLSTPRMEAMKTVVLLLSAWVLAEACATPGVPIPGGEHVTVDAPSPSVGDEWRYSGGFVLRVVGMRDGLIVTSDSRWLPCTQCRQFRDQNGTPVKIINAQGKEVVVQAAGQKLLDFPLRVGKEWSERFRAPSDGGVWFLFFNQFRVEAYEEITVKAGRFKAFRISMRQENQSPGSTLPAGWAHLWYAPDVKNLIKRRVYTSGWGHDWELEGYTVK